MQQPTLESTSTTAQWEHGLRAFLRELDVLVVAGRINPDARNVISWTLRRNLPQMECETDYSQKQL